MLLIVRIALVLATLLGLVATSAYGQPTEAARENPKLLQVREAETLFGTSPDNEIGEIPIDTWVIEKSRAERTECAEWVQVESTSGLRSASEVEPETTGPFFFCDDSSSRAKPLYNFRQMLGGTVIPESGTDSIRGGTILKRAFKREVASYLSSLREDMESNRVQVNASMRVPSDPEVQLSNFSIREDTLWMKAAQFTPYDSTKRVEFKWKGEGVYEETNASDYADLEPYIQEGEDKPQVSIYQKLMWMVAGGALAGIFVYAVYLFSINSNKKKKTDLGTNVPGNASPPDAGQGGAEDKSQSQMAEAHFEEVDVSIVEEINNLKKHIDEKLDEQEDGIKSKIERRANRLGGEEDEESNDVKPRLDEVEKKLDIIAVRLESINGSLADLADRPDTSSVEPQPWPPKRDVEFAVALPEPTDDEGEAPEASSKETEATSEASPEEPRNDDVSGKPEETGEEESEEPSDENPDAKEYTDLLDAAKARLDEVQSMEHPDTIYLPILQTLVRNIEEIPEARRVSWADARKNVVRAFARAWDPSQPVDSKRVFEQVAKEAGQKWSFHEPDGSGASEPSDKVVKDIMLEKQNLVDSAAGVDVSLIPRIVHDGQVYVRGVRKSL